jgi:hypothetical protein
MPELRRFIGKTVEIIVLEETPAFAEQPLETPETFFGLMPPELPQTPEQREDELRQLRDLAQTDPKLAAFLDAAAAGLDEEAIIDLRGRS